MFMRPGYLAGVFSYKPKNSTFQGAPGAPRLGPNIPGPTMPSYHAPIQPPGGLYQRRMRRPFPLINHVRPPYHGSRGSCGSCG